MKLINNITKVVRDDLEKIIQPGSRTSIAVACFLSTHRMLKLSDDNCELYGESWNIERPRNEGQLQIIMEVTYGHRYK